MGRTAPPPEAVDLGATAPPARRPRRGRLVVAIGVALALVVVGLAVVATRDDSESATDDRVDTFAPDVTVGNADLTVIATTVDQYGARAPLPADLVPPSIADSSLTGWVQATVKTANSPGTPL